MNTNRIIKLGIFISILVIGIFVSIGIVKSKKPIPKAKNSIPELYFKSQIVKNEKINYKLNYDGRVSSGQQISLSAEVTGVIKRGDVNFKEGTSFRKNDVLLKIEDDMIQASLNSLKSSFLTKLSTILPDIEIDYESEYEKWDKFFNSVQLNKKMPKIPEFNSKKERIFMAANDILRQYYEIVQKEISLGKHKIIAKFNGAISQCNSQVGSVASPGSKLATIIRTDKLEVEVAVKIADVKKLKRNLVCQVLDDLGNSYDARINRIANYVDTETQMVNVYVQIDGAKLYEGEYVKVDFPVESEFEICQLPREAINSKNKLNIIESNKIKELEIEVIHHGDDYCLVKGLTNDQIVVVESMTNYNKSSIIKPTYDNKSN
ncbi:MAG: efflux RND transporter periplasmic adaptor subunit [Marinifilaceae bacterium]|jgi:multidrug efflux pump subunit AcrA (membrane-fusion protein)|nr:efflux RND transporter periplasmic adaptor subunit [Marinifilaceae bacterium]